MVFILAAKAAELVPWIAIVPCANIPAAANPPRVPCTPTNACAPVNIAFYATANAVNATLNPVSSGSPLTANTVVPLLAPDNSNECNVPTVRVTAFIYAARVGHAAPINFILLVFAIAIAAAGS